MYKKSKTKGFTLLELLIALAILAIIAAILIPNFFAATDRARLRSDIQSARVIQNAIELYRAERGVVPDGVNPTGGGNMVTILETLTEAGFIRARDTDIQTEDADWIIDNHMVFVDISASSDNVKSIYASLSDAERELVVGGGS